MTIANPDKYLESFRSSDNSGLLFYVSSYNETSKQYVAVNRDATRMIMELNKRKAHTPNLWWENFKTRHYISVLTAFIVFILGISFIANGIIQSSATWIVGIYLLLGSLILVQATLRVVISQDNER